MTNNLPSSEELSVLIESGVLLLAEQVSNESEGTNFKAYKTKLIKKVKEESEVQIDPIRKINAEYQRIKEKLNSSSFEKLDHLEKVKGAFLNKNKTLMIRSMILQNLEDKFDLTDMQKETLANRDSSDQKFLEVIQKVKQIEVNAKFLSDNSFISN